MTCRAAAPILVTALGLHSILLGGCSRPPTVPTSTAAASGPSPTALTLTVPSTILQGEPAVQASASLELSDGSQVDLKDLKCQANWSSSASQIAHVDEHGVVEPIGFGVVTISVDCAGLRAESLVQIRRVFPIKGIVVEKYTAQPVTNATVTVTDGENAGMKTVTDSNGRFDFARLVDSNVRLEISAEGFGLLSLTNAASESEARFEVEPKFGERVLKIGPSPRSGEWTFDFETGHTGPVTVTLRADCLVHGPSWTWRLYTSVRSAADQKTVVWTGLGNGDWEAGPRSESTATEVAPPGRYRRVVRGDLNCQWMVLLRYPM